MNDSKRESPHPVLGPMAARKKTDLRLPYGLVKRVEELADSVGVPKNALFAMAAAMLVAQLTPLEPSSKKREQVLDEMERLFQNVVAEVRKIS